MKILTSQDLKNLHPYKYVRMYDNTFRFIHIEMNHSDMVVEGETVISAGLIGICDDSIKQIQQGSMSLKIDYSMNDDIDLLKELIGDRSNE